MKNKKIISLVCAISMIFTMFTAFTVAKADTKPGISFDLKQTSKTEATLTVKYVGFENGICGGRLAFTVPENATVKKQATSIEGANIVTNPEQDGAPVTDGTYIYSLALKSDTKATDHANGTGTIDVFTITLPAGMSKLSSDFIVELTDKTKVSTLVPAQTFKVSDESLPKAWTKLEAPKKTMSNTKPFLTDGSDKGIIDKDEAAVKDAIQGKKVYAAVDAKKANGDPAKYGDDYVAYYNGEELTEEQFNSLLAGAPI